MADFSQWCAVQCDWIRGDIRHKTKFCSAVFKKIVENYKDGCNEIQFVPQKDQMNREIKQEDLKLIGRQQRQEQNKRINGLAQRTTATVEEVEMTAFAAFLHRSSEEEREKQHRTFQLRCSVVEWKRESGFLIFYEKLSLGPSVGAVHQKGLVSVPSKQLWNLTSYFLFH